MPVQTATITIPVTTYNSLDAIPNPLPGTTSCPIGTVQTSGWSGVTVKSNQITVNFGQLAQGDAVQLTFVVTGYAVMGVDILTINQPWQIISWDTLVCDAGYVPPKSAPAVYYCLVIQPTGQTTFGVIDPSIDDVPSEALSIKSVFTPPSL